MKKRYKQKCAAVLAGVMLCSAPGMALPSYAAEAGVDVDETMYVNLDCYGAVNKVNVVKTLSMNGNTEFTDYGDYQQVINMSGDETPVLGEGSVQWSFPADRKDRFYYQCAIDKEQMILPWDFDVSYKLNGVPMDADKMAGVSGLVEIHIKATPNSNAKLYYRNNMVLIVAVPIDMEQCYSVEAEGSQTQTLGEATAVVFTALPGEEGDYTVRIGTDSFETTGVLMTMAPGTLDDLEHIKELKEDKDAWREAGDELYDSLEQMARSVESMREGVGQVQSGMASAENARQKWSSNKDSILAGNDQVLESLTALSKQMETIVPHLQTAKEEAEVIHRSLGDIVNTVGEMQEPLRRLETRLNNIRSSTEGMADQLPAIRSDIEIIVASEAILQQKIDAIIPILGNLSGALDAAESGYYLDDAVIYDEEALEEIEGGQSSTEAGSGTAGPGQPETGAPSEGETEAPSEGETGAPSEGETEAPSEGGTEAPSEGETAAPSEGETGAASESETEASQETESEAPAGEENQRSEGKEEEADVSPAEADSPAEISDKPLRVGKSKKQAPLVAASRDRKDDERDKDFEVFDSFSLVNYLDKIAKDSREFTDIMSNFLTNVSESADYSSEIVDYMDYLIEDVTALHDSLDTYYPDLQKALDDSAELVKRTTEALNNGISTMTIVQNTLKDTSNDLDAAVRDSLRGSMDLLDKSLSVLDSTTSMRQAGRTMKDVLDKELDKFEEENRFLYIDPGAEKESFTSDKNQEPKTLQIVLRTDEISLEEEEGMMDAEQEAEKVSPLRRMWNVLVKMWNAIVDIFRNR